MSAPWEQGSEYHWPEAIREPADAAPTWFKYALLLASGRDAFRLLLEEGRATWGWRRLCVPSYFCQEVVRSLAAAGLELQAYEDDPLREEPALPPLFTGDVLLRVKYFGLSRLPRLSLPEGAWLIEDHTHDPSGDDVGRSGADFVVASLRKTLPVPDGALLWSPRNHPLPRQPPCTREREQASGQRLSAMILKGRYLQSGDVSKPVFRELYRRGEEAMAEGTPSGMTYFSREILPTLPVSSWRDARRRNHATFRGRLAGCRFARVLEAQDGCVPFSAIVLFDSPERRDRVREGLIRDHIYPAVLWDLGDPVLPVGENTRALSQRMLSIHCDFRYGQHDMLRVADAVLRLGSGATC